VNANVIKPLVIIVAMTAH